MRVAVIGKDNRVENLILAGELSNENWVQIPDDSPVQAGHSYDKESGEFLAPEVQHESVQEKRIITKKAFLMRWTDDEAIAIDLASIHDPAADAQSQERSAYLRRQKEIQSQATYIDLDDKDTQRGVFGAMQLLEAMGKVAEHKARFDEFINAPVQPEERYTGPL